MDFQQFIRDERIRLNKEIDKLNKQKADLDAKIAEVQKELKAVDAYEKVKTGKSNKRRTGIRQDVFDVIEKHPKGIARQDIFSAMNAETKQDKQSISNAIANLKKKGAITGEDGIYKAASPA